MTAPGIERLLHVTAYNLYLSGLVGNPAPRVKALWDRMRAPVVGDYVMEISTAYDASRTRERCGKLLRVVDEPICTPEEWIAQGGEAEEDIPEDDAWYIELADGSEYRWHNCDFIAIPTMISVHDRPFESVPPATGGR